MRKRHNPPQPQRTVWADELLNFRGLFLCGHCHSPVTLDFSARNKEHGAQALPYLNRLQLQLIDQTHISTAGKRYGYEIKADSVGRDLHSAFKIEAFYPDGNEVIPTHLPPEIHSLYVDDLLQAKGSPRLTLFTCRLILEAACREKLGSDKGKLVNLIEKLGEAEALPKVMLDWAHTIRQFGNDAVHDATPPSHEEALEIKTFTEALLEFLYTYPARIAELRARKI